MAMSLDYNKRKRNYFTVTLPDGWKTETGKPTMLRVSPPTKRILDEITGMQRLIDNVTDESEADTVDILYSVCADILSHNKTGEVIEVEYLEDIFDITDVVLLYRNYCDFIAEESSEKN